VVHALLRLDVGGLERVVVDLASKNRRQGHRVTVLCLEVPGTLAPAVEALGAPVLSMEKPPGRVRDLPKRIAIVLRDLAPDVIHTHQVGALWYVGAAARAVGGIPVVHTEHTDNVAREPVYWRKLKTRALWWRAGRYASVFCCVSDSVAASARRWNTVPKCKVEVVLNGIDTSRYSDRSSAHAIRTMLGIPLGVPVIGSVGRLNEVKRQDLMIRALSALGQQFGNTCMLLVGDGPERLRLESLAAELGVTSRIYFAGYQPSPERFLAAMDLFVLSSRIEGLPLGLLEAWASGLPVVASAVGGLPKVVAHGETGLLFPSGDVEALAAAIRHLLRDPGTARRLGDAGCRTVHRLYSLDRMAEEYEGHYQRLTGRARTE
jgi:glycosyltransferase involved in cell wall biosynthesis